MKKCSHANEALALILSGLKSNFGYLARGMLHYLVFKKNVT